MQDTSAALDKAQRALETYRIRISEESAQIVRKERTALENRLEKGVQAAARRVEQAEKKRTQEKEKQKKSHAADATEEYRERIRQARKEMKEDMKKDRIPFYCSSSVWFSLFMPAFLPDYLFLAVTWLAASVGLPLLIYALLPDHQVWQFYILFPLFVAATIVLYIEILKRTKKKYTETLQVCRGKMNLIHDMKKKIKKTEKQIQKSDDESHYELKELDENISRARRELEAARKNQADGLKEFEQHTRMEIIEEFRVKSQEKLEELTAGIDQLTRQKNLTMEIVSELQLELIDSFEEQLGAENMNENRLRQLLRLLEDGCADTLEKAVELLKTEGMPENKEEIVPKKL